MIVPAIINSFCNNFRFELRAYKHDIQSPNAENPCGTSQKYVNEGEDTSISTLMDISSCESPPSPTSMEEDIDESIEDAFMNKLKDKCFSEDLVSQRSAELILQCERDAQRKKLLMEVNFIHYFIFA